MSKVTITELFPEDTATAANANATLTSWNTASADVDDTNIREGGVDRRTIAPRAITPTDGRPSQVALVGPSAGLAATGAATQVTFGATLIEIGPINFNAAAGDQLKVYCSFAYSITTGAGNAAEFKLGYASASGGPWTVINQTGRPANQSAGMAALASAPPETGSCTIAHKFTAATSSTLYLALLYTLAAGTLTISDLTFNARLSAK